MGVRVITDATDRMSALYDSVTELAFGPLFHNDEGSADEFLADWKGGDLRKLSNDQLFDVINKWHRARAMRQPEIPF